MANQTIPTLNLPLDIPRSPSRALEHRSLEATPPGDTLRRLTAVARDNHADLDAALLAVLFIMLSRLSAQEDFAVAVKHPGTPGHALLRCPPPDQPTSAGFIAGLSRRMEQDLKTDPAPGVSGDSLPAEPGAPFPTGSHVLFHPGECDTIDPRFDLLLSIPRDREPAGETPRLVFHYHAPLLEEDTVRRFAGYFKTLALSIAADPQVPPAQAEILPEEEKHKILEEFCGAPTNYPREKTIARLFEEQVERFPHRTALVGTSPGVAAGPDDPLHLTYKALEQEARRLARVLKAKGAGPDTVVALLADRSTDMMIGILGILSAGAAYLPLDPEMPEKRIRYMIADCAATLLVTHSRLLEFETADALAQPREGNPQCLLLEHLPPVPDTPPPTAAPQPHAGNLAYVIFTSGSTGNPKGVFTTQYNVTRVVKDTNYITVAETDRLLQLSSYAFDGSIFDIFGALLNGAALVLLTPREVGDARALAHIIRGQQVSVFFVTTALFNVLTDLELNCLAHVRRILFGGERVSVEHTRAALDCLGPGRVLHMYGPTETTVYASCHPIRDIAPAKVTIPIGIPLSNTYIYILDHHLNPVPIGAPGEIYIGGPGVAKGYLNQPELTAERFIPNPFLNSSAQSPPTPSPTTLYRTGDQARRLPDGHIEFLDRLDHQVKMRGFRIELGEIESKLRELQPISEAVVIDREDQRGEKYLCAYLVTSEEPRPDQLKHFLLEHLPPFMVPNYFIEVDTIPLTPNGKTDRKALPEPPSESGGAFVPPQNQTERKLAHLWARVLDAGEDDIGIDTDFFSLGGHSLKATTLLADIRKEMEVKIPLTLLYETPTIREIAHYLRNAEKEEQMVIRPAPKQEHYPLASAQKEYFILQQMNPGTTTYNMPTAADLPAPDRPRLTGALQTLLNRHEVLRTSFHMMENEPVQRVWDHLPAEPQFLDLDAPAPPHALVEAARRVIRPFDLSTPPLLRVASINAGPGNHILVMDMHHIIGDGHSLNLIKKEFLQLIHGNGPPLPQPHLHYKDYACWENSPAGRKVIEKQKSFWLKTFEDGVPTLELPTDFPRTTPPGSEGVVVDFELTTDEINRLKAFVINQNLSIYITLMGVFSILLSKLSGRDDIVAGSAVAGRSHKDLENVIGCFAKTLPIRNYPAPRKTAGQFLKEVKDRTLAVLENQEYPVEELIDRVVRKREKNRNALFDVLFSWQNLADMPEEPAAADQSPGQVGEDGPPGADRTTGAAFDISLSGGEIGQSLRFSLIYRGSLFKKTTILKYIRYFKYILASVLENPGQTIAGVRLSPAAEPTEPPVPTIIERKAETRQGKNRLRNIRTRRKKEEQHEQ